MSNIVIPYTFSPLTTIFSSQVNANYTAITNVVNGGLDNSNLASAAGIVLSKLSLNPGGAAFNKTTTGNQTWGSGLTTDSVPRVVMFSDKGLQFGPGAAGALDVAFQRTAANTLQLNNTAAGPATLDMFNGTIANLGSLSVPGAVIGPAAQFGVANTTPGSVELFGGTSGNAIIGVQPVAGATTFNLPVGNGTPGEFIQTDGAGNLSYASVSAQLIMKTVVNMTAAQFIALSATPVQLVPAPAAGITLIPISILFNFTAGSTNFTGGSAIYGQYGNTSGGGGTPITTVQPVVAVRTGSVLSVLVGANNSNQLDSYAAQPNAGLFLTSAANFVAGNGTAVVTTFYTQA